MKNKNVINYFWKNHKANAGLLAVFMMLANIMQTSSIAFLVPVLDYMKVNGEIDLTRSYWTYIDRVFSYIGIEISFVNLLVVVFLFLLSYQIFAYFRTIVLEITSAKVLVGLQGNMMNSILVLPYRVLSNYSSADLITFVNRQCVLATEVFKIFFNIMVTVTLILFQTGLMMLLNVKVTLISFSVIVLVLATTKLKFKAMKSIGHLINQDTVLFNRGVSEIFNAIKYIKVLGLERTSFIKMKTYLQQLFKNRKTEILIKSSLELFITPVYYALILIFLFVAVTVIHMPFANIMVYLLIASRILPLIPNLIREMSRLMAFVPSFGDINELISESSEDWEDAYNEVNIDRVIMKEMSFSYEDGCKALTSISATLEKNKIYGIVGKSGAGKSTLIDIILNILQQSEGSIEFQSSADDKTDRRKWNAFYLTQNPVVIEGTVRENLQFGKIRDDASDDDFLEALAHVGLDDAFKDREGLDTAITQEAGNISIGQKQRLALARLFLYDYSLIVLDECTSAVDERSKQLIIDAIKEIKESIVILVTHDLDVMETCDHVLEVNNGTLVSQEKSTYN